MLPGLIIRKGSSPSEVQLAGLSLYMSGKKEFYRISVDTFNFGFEIIEFI